MISRRAFVALAAVTLWGVSRRALLQPAERARRVGILDPGLPHLFDAFRQSMHELGYIEGQTIAYEVRNAKGNPAAVSALAAELVHLRPDVLVTAAILPTRVLMSQTSTIPIVVASIGDAVAAGIVRNLSQPVGNVTGVTFLKTELSAKRLELLKELLPRLRKVAEFNDLNSQESYRVETERAARLLRVELQRIDVQEPADIERAYDDAKRGTAEAIDVLASPFFNAHRAHLVELAARYRLPAIYESREYAQVGGLMTYGQDLSILFRRAATYVDKILKGAKPADLPWEQPTKFELVINLKAEKALGLTIPQSLLVRADDVIQ